MNEGTAGGGWGEGEYKGKDHQGSWFQEAYITVITKKTSQICYELKPELGLDKDPLKLNGLPLLIYMQLLFSSHC